MSVDESVYDMAKAFLEDDTQGEVDPKEIDELAQIGVFLRTEEGSVIEYTRDRATKDDVTFVIALIRGLDCVSPDVIAAVRKALDAKIAERQ